MTIRLNKIGMLLFLSCICIDLIGNVTLPRIFGDGMVLQRNQPISVWGWAEAGEKITVSLNQKQQTAIAGTDGKWRVKLAAEKAGGPFILTVNGKNSISISDVLIGEVWVCSGQSNMRWQVAAAANAREEIANANYTQIRQLSIPRRMADHPREDVDTTVAWRTATPEYVGDFTAVGYFYARELYNKLHIPIGLINTVWGGTMIESWISTEAMQADESLGRSIKILETENKDSIKTTIDARLKPNRYPTFLYNAMVNPIINYTIRGAIWYQGETNTERAFEYRKTFPLMIKDWRSRWSLGDFPFYFVQLSSFNAKGGNSAKGSTWAELREAQHRTLSVSQTGEAITTDIGNPKDIHPLNKQDVGKRLAAIALHDTYKQKVVFSGPVYQKFAVSNKQVILSFDHIHQGLMIRGGQDTLKGFEIAGADSVFHPAEATIKGKTIVVSSDAVVSPKAVRYGWADDASAGNLFNKDGFPATPFRTDDWPMITRKGTYLLKL